MRLAFPVLLLSVLAAAGSGVALTTAPLVDVEPSGNATGLVAVAPFGDANSVKDCTPFTVIIAPLCATGYAVSVTGHAGDQRPCDGGDPCDTFVATSVFGDAVGFVALSGTGNADSCNYFVQCDAVTLTGDADGFVAVSLTGHASGTVAVSGCDLAGVCRL